MFDSTAAGFTLYRLSGATGFDALPWSAYPQSIIDEAVYPAASWLMTYAFAYDINLNQDLNGDGVSLLVAYALNLDPNLNLAGSMPGAVIGPDTLGMTYYAASPGITYTVETSDDLESWTTIGVSISGLDAENQRTASVDLNDPCRFLRLRVAD
ncbi:MAG: hypothetical protein K9M45_05345 [Kiritimatiellales bacterium]|nr:hypothetical protein [Kiritimatiellales bacterium]